MEKIQGVKNFGNEGEGRFHEILSCPPPNCVLLLKCPPPQIPKPGAATGYEDVPSFLNQWKLIERSYIIKINMFY